MDVLLRWITMPGNVKRWRMETHSPLVREVVEIMQEEGLAHRQAPFVRYKLDAIEKQYITAKQWLLETGMHDAYMRGKSSKEVKAHVQDQHHEADRPIPADLSHLTGLRSGGQQGTEDAEHSPCRKPQ